MIAQVYVIYFVFIKILEHINNNYIQVVTPFFIILKENSNTLSQPVKHSKTFITSKNNTSFNRKKLKVFVFDSAVRWKLKKSFFFSEQRVEGFLNLMMQSFVMVMESQYWKLRSFLLVSLPSERCYNEE